jgi:hypothetical protein
MNAAERTISAKKLKIKERMGLRNLLEKKTRGFLLTAPLGYLLLT